SFSSTFPTMSRLFARSLVNCDSATSARSSATSKSRCTFRNLSTILCCFVLFVFLWYRFSYPVLHLLECFLPAFHGKTFSLIQTLLEVLDCHLQVLFHPLQVRDGSFIQVDLRPEGVVAAACLGFQGTLQGVHGSLVVPLHLVHLFIFLYHFSVNL
uniref:Uncharacterized protein n=1 Tax=Hippocampus comes TaxID=109280 RepID=A0A3Q2XLF1_HIPCM